MQDSPRELPGFIVKTVILIQAEFVQTCLGIWYFVFARDPDAGSFPGEEGFGVGNDPC